MGSWQDAVWTGAGQVREGGGLGNTSVFLGCTRELRAWVWNGGNSSKRGDAPGKSLPLFSHSLSTLLKTHWILFPLL